jgi:hypothetical protein
MYVESMSKEVYSFYLKLFLLIASYPIFCKKDLLSINNSVCSVELALKPFSTPQSFEIENSPVYILDFMNELTESGFWEVSIFKSLIIFKYNNIYYPLIIKQKEGYLAWLGVISPFSVYLIQDVKINEENLKCFLAKINSKDTKAIILEESNSKMNKRIVKVILRQYYEKKSIEIAKEVVAKHFKKLKIIMNNKKMNLITFFKTKFLCSNNNEIAKELKELYEYSIIKKNYDISLVNRNKSKDNLRNVILQCASITNCTIQDNTSEIFDKIDELYSDGGMAGLLRKTNIKVKDILYLVNESDTTIIFPSIIDGSIDEISL